MSRIRANTITNQNANGAPDFPDGITVTGIITATSISQSLNGNLTVTGNLGVGGTITYEDVTNIDSVGVVTARNGIKIGPAAGVAGTFFADGSYVTAGIVTATNFVGGGANLTNIPAGQLTGTVADARISTLTASKLSGALPSISGANLTSLPTQVTLSNNADNRVITGGSGVNVNGESNLTFDGSKLTVTGQTEVTSDLDIASDIRHIGDTNTKIRFPQNDRITFETAGSEKLKIDSNGQIIFTNSIIAEKFHNDTGGGITGNYNHDIMTYGLVFYGATNAGGSFTFNLRGNGSTTFESITNTGTTTAFTAAVAVNNTGRYMTAFKIDGSTQTVQWNGGSAPSAAGSGGIDVYTFQIMKTGSSAYVVLGNYANFD